MTCLHRSTCTQNREESISWMVSVDEKTTYQILWNLPERIGFKLVTAVSLRF